MKNSKNIEILNNLGQKIRDLRLYKSLSQEELAAIAGVHRTYIGMVERGEKNTTILTLVRISNALEVKLTDIIKEV